MLNTFGLVQDCSFFGMLAIDIFMFIDTYIHYYAKVSPQGAGEKSNKKR